MQIKLPLLAIAAKAWAGVLSLFAIPLYIRLMSVDEYGVIALFALITSFVLVLDFGIPAWLTREFAKPDKPRLRLQQADLLLDTDRLCALAFSIISLTGLLWSWLSDNSAKQVAGGCALILGCATLAAQWIGLVYAGIVQGRQNFKASALVIGVGATIRVVSTLGLLYIEPSLTVYFFVNFLVFFGQAMAFRYFANIERVRDHARGPGRKLWVRRAVQFSMAMTPMSILSVVLSQADKVMVGYFSSIKDFSIYMLAWALPGALGLIAITPIGSMALAVLARSFDSTNADKMWKAYTALTAMMVIAVVPAATIMVAVPDTVLALWGLPHDAVVDVSRVLPILVVGTAINGIMSIPYTLQIATGWTRLPLIMNTAAVLISLPTSAVLASRFGAVGAASGWLMTNLLFLVVWPYLMHRRLFRSQLLEWLGFSVLFPTVVAVCVCLVAIEILSALLPETLAMRSWAAAAAMLMGLISCFIASPASLKVTLLSRLQGGK